ETPPTIDSRATIGFSNLSEVVVGGRSNEVEDWQTYATTGNRVAVGNWYYVVGVIDYAGDLIKIYINGAFEGEGTVNFSQSTTPATTATNSAIGAQDDGSDDFFNGTIDEVRISDLARTPSWIAAQYLSHTDNFITFGEEENSP
ncbi:MAG: LamG domain-containing protein, partial [Deltaproteobacteria bacterium]|nr:LamG domain-containing protein [Deltaproteobacteria bacterium]